MIFTGASIHGSVAITLIGFCLLGKAFSDEIDGRPGDRAFAGYLFGGLFISSLGIALTIAVGLNIL